MYKVALLVGKGVEGVTNTLIEEVGVCVMYWIGKLWKRRKDVVWGANGQILVLSPPPSMKSWTHHMHY